MNEIPPIYWMIVIGVIAIMVCVVLFYIAMVLLESKKAIEESRKIIEDAGKTLRQVDLIVNDLQVSISSVREAVGELINLYLFQLENLIRFLLLQDSLEVFWVERGRIIVLYPNTGNILGNEDCLITI